MRRIEGWEYYSITEDGNLWSHRSNRYLNIQVNRGGYLQVQLSIKGKSKMFTVHRLVAKAFIPNPDNLPEINHIDGNKKNNNISNLEWVTSSTNQKHAYSNKLQIHKKGEDWHSAKLTKEDVKYIRENYKFRDKEFSFVGMARKFKVSPVTICEAYHGINWSTECV